MERNPLLAFSFIADWEGIPQIGFSEVSGLNFEKHLAKNNAAMSNESNATQITGHVKYFTIILKRGLVKKDNKIMEWINSFNNNSLQRRDITISMLNEIPETIISWTLKNAWPVKYSTPITDINASYIAIEMLELAYEKLLIVK